MSTASAAHAQIAFLPDQRRLHLQDGPIDLVVEAFGPLEEVRRAYEAAALRFVSVLDELCGELPLLRQPATVNPSLPHGPIAQRMMLAVKPFADETFITPMAAVAGAVAEEILLSMTNAANLAKAYVNNGGDIALHLSPGERFVAGAVETAESEAGGAGTPARAGPRLFATTALDSSMPVRGIATSGWPGRSFSLGIADAVTVLAKTAAVADAAATIIANAVDLPGHPNITRVPARTLAPDSDLGIHLVTQHVGYLSLQEIDSALSAGSVVAESLVARGLVHSAALHLQGQTRIVALDTRNCGGLFHA